MSNLEKAKKELNKNKIIIISDLSEAPMKIRNEIRSAQTDDILDRYDNEDYHDSEIINNILEDHGYKIADTDIE